MSHKAGLYTTALDQARRAGRWNEPLASPNIKKGLSWSELIRKYRKHNPSEDLVGLTAEAEQLVHTNLAQVKRSAGFDDDKSYESDFGLASFPREESAGKGKQVTELTFPPLLGGSHATAARAKAAELRTALERQADTPSITGAQFAATIVLALADYALGNFDESLRLLDALAMETSTNKGHNADLQLQSCLLEGLLYERRSNPAKAVQVYSRGAQLYEQSEDRKTASNKEFSRLGEKICYRRALLSYKVDPRQSIIFHRAHPYVTALPFKRGTILRAHLRLLYSSASPSPDEIREVQDHYNTLLRKHTKFPKAGQVNARMLDFVDRVYEGWKLLNSSVADPNNIKETLRCIRILEDAIAYTFHSHRILRHLTRLHMFVGDYFLAEKNFELYSQLWEKAKETDLLNVTREMRAYRNQDASRKEKSPIKQNDYLAKGGATSDAANADEQIDLDSETQYLETLCGGVRLYCKHLRTEESAKTALRHADRAVELVDEYKIQDARLKAKVLRWRGVALAHFAVDESDPETRKRYHASAVAALQESASLQNSFSTFFHSAFVLGEQRQIKEATVSIRKALELSPNNVEAQHLHILLISARNEDYKGALAAADKACDSGANTPPRTNGFPTNGLSTGSTPNRSTDQLPNSDIHPPVTNGFSPTDPANGPKDGSEGIGGSAPDKSGNLKPFPEPPEIQIGEEGLPMRAYKQGNEQTTYRTAAQIDSELRLRITRNSLIELVRGAQAALQDQQEILELYSSDFTRLAGYSSHPDLKYPYAPHVPEPAPSADDINGKSGRRKRAQTVLPKPAPIDTAVRRHFSLRSTLSPRRTARVSSGTNTPLGMSQSRNGTQMSLQLDRMASRTSVVSQSTQIQTPASAAAVSRATTPHWQADHQAVRDWQVSLWLLAAATFRRMRKFAQAKAAIRQAHNLDMFNPDVHLQLGLVRRAEGKRDAAIAEIDTALTCSLDHIPAVVHMARLRLEQGGQCVSLAEGFLDILTQTNGWDISEGWFLLAQVYKATDRNQRAVDALEYALELQLSRPIREVKVAVPRVL